MKEKELTAEEIYPFNKYFTSIYNEKCDEVNPMPEGVKLTAYCDNGEEEGYVIDCTTLEMGWTQFIAKTWILHSELEKLIEGV